jgi:F0F1-type ATP synthase epsilon subunit
MTSLNTGGIHYRDENGKDHYVFVSGGFAEALPDKVTILAESAEKMKAAGRRPRQGTGGHRAGQGSHRAGGYAY